METRAQHPRRLRMDQGKAAGLEPATVWVLVKAMGRDLDLVKMEILAETVRNQAAEESAARRGTIRMTIRIACTNRSMSARGPASSQSLSRNTPKKRAAIKLPERSSCAWCSQVAGKSQTFKRFRS